MTATIPASGAPKGSSYWGLASVLAIGAAPALGFWVYQHGWTALCLELTVAEPADGDDRVAAARRSHGRTDASHEPKPGGPARTAVVEWRVLLPVGRHWR